MKYLLLLSCWLVVCTCSYASERLSQTQMREYYTVVIAGQYLDEDARALLVAAYLGLGIDPKFVELPSARAEREIDGVYFNALAEQSSRHQPEHLVAVPLPLGQRQLHFYSLDTPPPELNALSGRTSVGFLKGSQEAQWWLAQQRLHSRPASSSVKLLQMLAAGRIDYVLAEPQQLASALPGSAIARRLQAGPPVWRWQTYHYLHASQQALLVPLMQEMLRAQRALND